MSDGKKWAAEQDEENRKDDRKKLLQDMIRNPASVASTLQLFDDIKRLSLSMGFDRLQMSYGQHQIAREMQKKIDKLP